MYLHVIQLLLPSNKQQKGLLEVPIQEYVYELYVSKIVLLLRKNFYIIQNKAVQY